MRPKMQHMIETCDIKTAAKLLGLCTARVAYKAKRGLIPGAFKAGLRWMFIVEKLVDYIHGLENSQREVAQVGKKGNQLCRSVKRKIARIGIQGSQSAELECRNQLDALFVTKLRSTKTDAERKLENRYS